MHEIDLIEEGREICSIENFDNTGINATIDQIETRSANSEMYVISVQKENVNETQSITLLVANDVQGNTIVTYYNTNNDLLGHIEYDSNWDIITTYAGKKPETWRLEGESWSDCTSRLIDIYEHHILNSGLSNKIAYKLAPLVLDALFIATAAGCCYYGCH